MQHTSEKEPRTYEIAVMMPEEGSYDEVKKIITNAGATVIVESPAKRVQLGYPIKKATHGSFISLHATMDPSAAKTIEKEMLHNPHILRSLMIVVPPKKEPKVKPAKKEKDAAKKAEKTAKKSEENLTNEALEKQIQDMMA
ncbi:MAG: Ribosomal protein [Candidatus Parcubacteria bacterium]|jgi:ribosomal protein S6